jgi:hypothetical protein
MKNILVMFILLIGSALVVPFSAAQGTQAAHTVTGKWHFVFSTEGGDRTFDPVFQQNGDQVTGKWGASDVKGTLTDGTLSLEFPYNSEEGGPGTLKIKGALAEDALSGDWAFNDYTGSFKATRVKE